MGLREFGKARKQAGPGLEKLCVSLSLLDLSFSNKHRKDVKPESDVITVIEVEQGPRQSPATTVAVDS